jgi:heme A synthase
MKIQLWLRVTSLVVFLQIALGGLLTFSFITALPHIITGFAVLAFAIVTLVMAQTLKPPFRPLLGLSVGLVLLVVVQIILGFTTLGTGNQVIAWIHLLVAMGIYGMAIAGTFMSMRLDYRSREQSVPSNRPQA